MVIKKNWRDATQRGCAGWSRHSLVDTHQLRYTKESSESNVIGGETMVGFLSPPPCFFIVAALSSRCFITFVIFTDVWYNYYCVYVCLNVHTFFCTIY